MSPLPSPAFRFRAKLHQSKRKTTPPPKLEVDRLKGGAAKIAVTSPASRGDTESPKEFARLPYRALRRQGALLYIPQTPPTPTPSSTGDSGIHGCLGQCSPAALNGTNSTPSRTMAGLEDVDNDSQSSFNEILSSGGSVSIVAAFELPNPFTLLKVDVFDPKVASGSDALFLLRLDDPQEGLSESQFIRLLAKCGACKNILTKRSILHHECPPRPHMKDALESPPPAPAGLASQLLDTFMPGGEFGMSIDVFQENFVRCMDCHQFLTRRASSLHNCKLEQEFRELASTYGLKLI